MPSALPAKKLLRVSPGVTFDYRFQYLDSNQGPIDLSHYTAVWTLTWKGGSFTYGNVPATSLPTQSGVAFGGDSATPTNGTIDLVISASDTLTVAWTEATYDLRLINTVNAQIIDLLTGGIVIRHSA